MGKLALVASSYPPIYGAIDSFRRLIITPILVLSAIPGLDRAIMGERKKYCETPFFLGSQRSHFIPGAKKRPSAMQAA